MIRFAAPGRINLIGEHTDYNRGFALPIALPEHTVATFVPTDDEALTVRSDRQAGVVRIPLDTSPGAITGWAAYVAGVVWALRRADHPVVGGDLTITSGVEVGAGLASSAALSCAVLGAILHATHTQLGPIDQARAAQAAENEYIGSPTGLLDQLASLCAQPLNAMLIDFDAVSVRQVPFDPVTSGVALLLIDSRERHRNADGEYAARRASCERAAADLGATALRHVHRLDAVRDSVDACRARHVLTENTRVLEFVGAVESGDFASAGQLLTASHASMRDDFAITTTRIDLIAQTAVRAGALGARMTGGGFGGCVIALVPAREVGTVTGAVLHALSNVGYPEPAITRTFAGSGARLL